MVTGAIDNAALIKAATLVEDVKKQMQAELGEDEEEVEKIPLSHKIMLEQKYGLRAAELTPSEKNLILKDERNG